jgi:hypothetical protein
VRAPVATGTLCQTPVFRSPRKRAAKRDSAAARRTGPRAAPAAFGFRPSQCAPQCAPQCAHIRPHREAVRREARVLPQSHLQKNPACQGTAVCGVFAFCGLMANDETGVLRALRRGVGCATGEAEKDPLHPIRVIPAREVSHRSLCVGRPASNCPPCHRSGRDARCERLARSGRLHHRFRPLYA